MESVFERVAAAMQVDATQLRLANMYRPEGDHAPYGQLLTHCNALRCWRACEQMANYEQRLRDVEEWNR
jgi:xanthine dehydrogenase molybdopterin-binding subunit B